MSDVSFPITPALVNICRTYHELKNKRLNELNVKSVKEDNYINTITKNAFRLLAKEIPQEFLKNGNLDYNQWRWISDVALGRNPYIKFTTRHGKQFTLSHKMETKQTIQGKDSGYGLDPFGEAWEKYTGSIPVYESNDLSKELAAETKHQLPKDFCWQNEAVIDEKIEQSKNAAKLQEHLANKREQEAVQK